MLGLYLLHSKKHLSFTALRKLISERVSKLVDTRQEAKVEYLLHDCCQSAFAMMFFQDPSLNAFQNKLQEKQQLNNLKTMFNVTDIPITKDNIVELVKGGRARWKIENEAFNTLKNQGYHLEHNFGHGVKYLSYSLLLFNFLAFFMHQIFELSDRLYQKCRCKFTSRIEYWNQLRCTIRILIFPSFESLLTFIIDPEAMPP
jgi:hypothetical protein